MESTTIAWNDATQQASNHSILMVQGRLVENDRLYHENAVAKAMAYVIDAIWATAALTSTRDSDSNSAVNSELGSKSSQEPESELIKISEDWAARVVDVYIEYQPDITKMALAQVLALALAGVSPMPDIIYGPYRWKTAHTDRMHRGLEADAVSLSQAQYDAASDYFHANGDILSEHADVILYAAANWTDPRSLYQLRVRDIPAGLLLRQLQRSSATVSHRRGNLCTRSSHKFSVHPHHGLRRQIVGLPYQSIFIGSSLTTSCDSHRCQYDGRNRDSDPV